MSAPLLQVAISAIAAGTNFDTVALTGGSDDGQSLSGYTGADYLFFPNAGSYQWLMKAQGGKQLFNAMRILSDTSKVYVGPGGGIDTTVNTNSASLRFAWLSGSSGSMMGLDAGHIDADQKHRRMSIVWRPDYGTADTLRFHLSDSSAPDQTLTLPTSGAYLTTCDFVAAGPGASLSMDLVRNGTDERSVHLQLAWLSVPVPPNVPRVSKY